MQTCSRCNAVSPDAAPVCVRCGAELALFSTRAMALSRLQANPRVRSVRLSVAQDACPACQDLFGTYPKEAASALPNPSCSHSNGCRCFYEPVLSDTAVVSKVGR